MNRSALICEDYNKFQTEDERWAFITKALADDALFHRTRDILPGVFPLPGDVKATFIALMQSGKPMPERLEYPLGGE